MIRGLIFLILIIAFGLLTLFVNWRYSTVLLVILIVILEVTSDNFKRLRLIRTTKTDNQKYISLVDEVGEVIWETNGNDWEIRDGDMIFKDENGRVLSRSNTRTGVNVKLQNGGEFHGLNLMDADNNVIWNPSHYSKFIDPEESLKKRRYIYRNPHTGELFSI